MKPNNCCGKKAYTHPFRRFLSDFGVLRKFVLHTYYSFDKNLKKNNGSFHSDDWKLKTKKDTLEIKKNPTKAH